MKHVRTMLLAAVIALSGVLPAFAAQGMDVTASFPARRTYREFSDVGSGDWFAPYVKTCYETALLSGVDGGRFLPGQTVSVSEAAAAAARIHHLLGGGSGTLPAAPARGDAVLTLEDGTVLSGVTFADAVSWEQGAGVLYLRFSDQATTVLRGGERPVDRMFLRTDGRSYQGDYRRIAGGFVLDEDPWEGYVLQVDDGYDLYSRLIALDLLEKSGQTLAGKWYRDTWWYLYSHWDVFQDALPEAQPEDRASRGDLAALLAAVTPEALLTPMNNITRLPDSDEPGVLAFYNAGILTGVDRYGTFRAKGQLTRAELAAMLARLVRPALRVAFAPEAAYTTTPVAIDSQRYEVLNSRSDYRAAGTLLYLKDTQTGKTGVMAANGSWVLQANRYDSVMPFCADGVAAVCRNGLWGYVNLKGEEVISCDYTAVTRYHNGLLLAQRPGEREYIALDTAGGVHGTVPEGIYAYDTTGTYLIGPDGYYKVDGTLAVPLPEGAFFPVVPQPFTEGYAVVADGRAPVRGVPDTRLRGAIDGAGNLVIPFRYLRLEAFREGLAQFMKAPGVFGYLTAGGEELYPEETGASQFTSFSGGYAAFQGENGRMGYIDREMRTMVPPCLDWAGAVSGKQALVGLNGGVRLLAF
ncbi:MAG: hypothetical protein GX585_02550 [Clostridiales bacterium]|nr:hypothetical protein [Clostridiales bacterium]